MRASYVCRRWRADAQRVISGGVRESTAVFGE